MIGPRGEKRPNSPVANAALIVKLATGQVEEEYVERPGRRPAAYSSPKTTPQPTEKRTG